eukprot:7671518-Alexandrium_andersonii.AAC.1
MPHHPWKNHSSIASTSLPTANNPISPRRWPQLGMASSDGGHSCQCRRARPRYSQRSGVARCQGNRSVQKSFQSWLIEHDISQPRPLAQRTSRYAKIKFIRAGITKDLAAAMTPPIPQLSKRTRGRVDTRSVNARKYQLRPVPAR